VEGPLAPVALLSRTSERDAGAVAGVRELAARLGAPVVGTETAPRDGHWTEDLAAGRDAMREAGRLVAGALDAGTPPLLIAGHCPVAMGTLPAVIDRRPEASILWLDAHGDFNTPETTQSEFLGGMCLSAACGLWDAVVATTAVPPQRVHLHGARDLDPAEVDLLAEHGVRRDLPAEGPVFIHLDLDVLDPTVMPAAFPAPGGLSWDELDALLAELAGRCEILGVEVTCAPPGHADRIAATLAHLP
jgi:arginase